MCLLSFLVSLFVVGNAFALTSYADLVDEVMPSVVNISTQKEVIAQDDTTNNMMINPSLSGRESLGSGFFIRTDGYVLTNLHVIEGAKKISVITNNDKQYDAKVIGKDKPSDLAVLKIEDKDAKFRPVKFGDVDEARIGDIILAFGNPYGLGLSVSQGIISAKSRSIGIGEQQYIQTDAAINQGNSGGPLFNLDGEVIGVNSAIFKDIGANGVGFSLPSNIANWISNQLIDTGHVKRGWIGLKVAIGIDKYTDKSGFMVTEIDENSNAFKEGLRVGDIITFYNDKPANDLNEFIQFTETMEPGQALRLKTLSYGQETRNVIRVQEMPAETLKNITNKALIESKMYAQKQYGDDIFYISELKIAVKEANPRGLAVVKLERKSPLFGKGIEEGDIILEADRSDIYSVDNLLDNIRNSIVDDYRPISLLIQGIDNTFYANIELEPEND